MKRPRLRNPLNIRMSDDLLLSLEQIASTNSMSVSDIVRIMILSKLPEVEAGEFRLRSFGSSSRIPLTSSRFSSEQLRPGAAVATARATVSAAGGSEFDTVAALMAAGVKTVKSGQLAVKGKARA